MLNNHGLRQKLEMIGNKNPSFEKMNAEGAKHFKNIAAWIDKLIGTKSNRAIAILISPTFREVATKKSKEKRKVSIGIQTDKRKK